MVRHLRATFAVIMTLTCGLVIEAGLAVPLARAQEGQGLTVHFVDADHDPVVGVTFRAYNVRGLEDANRLIATDGISAALAEGDFTVELADAAAAFGDQIEADAIEPDAEAVTDEAGEARFERLDEGIYLVEGDEVEKATVRVTPQPFFATETGDAYPKALTTAVMSPDPEPVDEPVDDSTAVPNTAEGDIFAKTGEGPWEVLLGIVCGAAAALFGITHFVKRREALARRRRYGRR